VTIGFSLSAGFSSDDYIFLLSAERGIDRDGQESIVRLLQHPDPAWPHFFRPGSRITQHLLFQALGRNAARYAMNKTTEPVPVRIDNMARLKYIVQSTLWHRVEVEAVETGSPAVEVTLAPVSARESPVEDGEA
jgi:hypothetical protein